MTPPYDVTSRMVQAVPELPGPIGFNAQHAPMGAFMSFTCGCPNAGCGLGVELGRPASQNLFIGVKQGGRYADAPIRCLPFFRDAGAQAASALSYDVENPNAARALNGIEAIDLANVRRRFGWASDTWITPNLTFRVDTPFGPIPEPGTPEDTAKAMRSALRPAVTATLQIDNRSGTDILTGVFALDFIEPGVRVLWRDDERGRGAAVAYRRHMGVAARLADAAPEGRLVTLQQWSVADALGSADPVHALGTCGGFCFEVPPGQRRTLILSLGVYLDGIVTTGIETQYLYTRYFASLEDVLESALKNAPASRRAADELDRQLLASNLSADQQFQLAHATRSYYGSTQLLDAAGEPVWVVNEGEYCMLNTLDLSIDHAFWELRHNPWVVRNLLEQFAKRYSYGDTITDRDGNVRPGGVSFTHDMGANNHFSPPGRSSYERTDLTGCFSYMTQEQLCNWILLAGCYVAATGDEAWLARRADLLKACAQSMTHRADPDTGVMAYDSTRCGSGSEITTYDSLDESLGQARANTYIAVKCWAAWLALEMLHATDTGGEKTGFPSLADKIADHICSSVKPDGTLPAVLEKDSAGYGSRILPVIEALTYPHDWLRCLAHREITDDSRQRLTSAMRHPMIGVLKEHTRSLLHDPEARNLFNDGGIRLSSTSANSWMSKIALCQHVIRDVLHLSDGDQAISKLMQRADRTHVDWQIVGSAYWASSDQFINGVAKGSRYYPRNVTAVLWLNENPTARGVGTSSRQTSDDAMSPGVHA